MSRILVIESDDLVRFTLRRMLEESGYEVAEATDVSCVLQSTASFAPALIILDMSLPLATGEPPIEKIRGIWPRIKILGMNGAMSRHSFARLPVDASLKVDAVRLKPISFHSLRAIVGKLLADGPWRQRAARPAAIEEPDFGTLTLDGSKLCNDVGRVKDGSAGELISANVSRRAGPEICNPKQLST